MTREYHFHTKGNKDQIREALDLLDGVIQTMVTDEEEINITWNANTDPLPKVADILQNGNYADGILLLELFLSADPDDTNVLSIWAWLTAIRGIWNVQLSCCGS